MSPSREKRRYVIIRVRNGLKEPREVLNRVVEIVVKAFGIVGLSQVDPRVVSEGQGTLHLISVSREGLDKLLAAFVIADERDFEIVKVTGTIRKARRIISSLGGT